MIHRKEFTKFAKKIVRAQKDLKNQQLMHPRREWMIGIVIAVCIFAASITWSSLQYFKYQDIEQLATDQTNNTAIVYKKSLVTQALSIFEQKTTRLNKLLGTQTAPNQTQETEVNLTDTVEQSVTAEKPAKEIAEETKSPEQTNASSTETDNASTTAEKTTQGAEE